VILFRLATVPLISRNERRRFICSRPIDVSDERNVIRRSERNIALDSHRILRLTNALPGQDELGDQSLPCAQRWNRDEQEGRAVNAPIPDHEDAPSIAVPRGTDIASPKPAVPSFNSPASKTPPLPNMMGGSTTSCTSR
jgi:hypothetical protein